MDQADTVTMMTSMFSDIMSRMEEMENRNRVNLAEIRGLVETRNQTPPSAAASPLPELSESPVAAPLQPLREPETRRETYVVAPDHMVPETGARLGTMQLTAATVIQQQERVDPAAQIKYASFPALKVGIDNQAYHLAQFSQFKPLALFVVVGVLRLLVENEHRHNRNLDMTETTILKHPDEAFIKIFAAYLRVTSMGTKEAFTETILHSVPPLKAYGPDPDRPMGIKDYDLHFHAPVNKHLLMLEKVFEYAYEGATVRETRDWPLEPYGKGDNFGQIHICCRSLDQYRANFEHYIGIEALKAMKTRLEWFKEMRKVNNETANKAAEQRADESRIREAVKLDTIVKKVQDRRAGPKAVMTRDGPRDARLPMTPFTRPTNAGQAPFRASAPELTRHHHHNPVERNRPGYPTYGRQAKVEYEEDYNLMDETGDCDNPLLSGGLEEVRRQFLPFEERDEDDWNWRHFDDNAGDALNAMYPANRSPTPGAQKVLYDPKQPKPRDPLKPCFRHFEKKDCPGNCGWDHSQAGMHKLMLERLETVLDSPFTPIELVKSEIAKREQRSSPRRMSAISAAETWEEAEAQHVAQHVPLSPSVARITHSSQPIPNTPSGASQESS